jgi:hypothetical protein
MSSPALVRYSIGLRMSSTGLRDALQVVVVRLA